MNRSVHRSVRSIVIKEDKEVPNEEWKSTDALQKHNKEMLKCINDLRMKRDELQKQVIAEEKEKKNIEADVKRLTSRLWKVSESLANKISARRECDIIIAETRAVYTKILERSKDLHDEQGNFNTKD